MGRGVEVLETSRHGYGACPEVTHCKGPHEARKVYPEYRQRADEDLLEALIELYLDNMYEICQHVWLLVGLLMETCADLLGFVSDNAEFVHCRRITSSSTSHCSSILDAP